MVTSKTNCTTLKSSNMEKQSSFGYPIDSYCGIGIPNNLVSY